MVIRVKIHWKSGIVSSVYKFDTWCEFFSWVDTCESLFHEDIAKITVKRKVVENEDN